MEAAIRAKRVTIWKVFMVLFTILNILCIKNGVRELVSILRSDDSVALLAVHLPTFFFLVKPREVR
jgi:hypothetical protein